MVRLHRHRRTAPHSSGRHGMSIFLTCRSWQFASDEECKEQSGLDQLDACAVAVAGYAAHSAAQPPEPATERSEEPTPELQPLMPTSLAVFCLKKKKQIKEQ